MEDGDGDGRGGNRSGGGGVNRLGRRRRDKRGGAWQSETIVYGRRYLVHCILLYHYTMEVVIEMGRGWDGGGRGGDGGVNGDRV